MKICFVTSIYPPNHYGGPGEVALNLQRYFLENQGSDAYVLTCGRGDSRYPNTLRTPGGKRLFALASPYLFLKKIQNGNFDILNIQSDSGIGIAPFLFAQ